MCVCACVSVYRGKEGHKIKITKSVAVGVLCSAAPLT